MRALLCCLAWLNLLSACGGAPNEASPKTAADESPSAASKPSSTRQNQTAATDEAEEPRGPTGPSCDDGTCSLCGSGICPAGWYCDAKAGACSWLAECAEKPSCSCITRVLGSSCKCDAASGGPKVACD
jgi:hypothetical protein